VRFGFLLWLAPLVLFGAAGFGAGWLLKGGGEAPFTFDSQAAPYQQADSPAAHSRSGFTGFGDQGGLAGQPIIGGKVSAVAPDTLVLSTAAGPTTIRLTGEQKLRRLQSYDGPIQPGMTVFVTKKPGTDEAAALLVLLDP
jgi:hypothetical protein